MKPKIRFKGFEGEWKASTIGEIAPLQRGYDLPTNNVISGTIPVVYSNGILRFHNEGKCQAPAIITGRSGTIGKFTYIDHGEYWPHNTSLWVTTFHKNYPRFVYYFFQNVGFEKYATGSGVPTLNRNDIHKHIESIPSNKEEQQAIASYFTFLDSQISASTSCLASLKQMKAASLQAMFPQEGETVPKIRFKGFEGEWNISRLGDFSTSFSGGTPTAGVAEFYGGEIPFIRSGEIHENRTELFLTEAGINNSSAKVVEKGTLLYALYGATSGEVGISKIKGAINQAILAIYPNKSVNKIFLSNYLQLKKQRIVGEFLQGGQGNLSGALVKSILVTYPSLEEQQAIASYFTSLDRQISLQSQRLEKLKQIKSACLDKMFV